MSVFPWAACAERRQWKSPPPSPIPARLQDFCFRSFSTVEDVENQVPRDVYIFWKQTNKPNRLRRGLPKRAPAVSTIFSCGSPALRRRRDGEYSLCESGAPGVFWWFYSQGCPRSLHFPHVSGISVPPVVGVQSRALAVLDAATWSGGRGTAGGAEPRGSRVASILESLAPGSGLQGWFLEVDGNQVTEILKLPDYQTCRGDGMELEGEIWGRGGRECQHRRPGMESGAAAGPGPRFAGLSLAGVSWLANIAPS